MNKAKTSDKTPGTIRVGVELPQTDLCRNKNTVNSLDIVPSSFSNKIAMPRLNEALHVRMMDRHEFVLHERRHRLTDNVLTLPAKQLGKSSVDTDNDPFSGCSHNSIVESLNELIFVPHQLFGLSAICLNGRNPMHQVIFVLCLEIRGISRYLH